MTAQVRIDFVSDVSCPWCAIGLKSLEQALERLAGEIDAELHFEPFELNPDMPAGGQDVTEHLVAKYGVTPEQTQASREAIRARGEEVGFTFRMDRRTRIYNTFDAHRLLHWAGLEGRQRELKHALLAAYFTDGENPSDHDVLARRAAAAGLDEARARAILASDEFARDVREREGYWLDHDIHAVPAVVVNGRHLIQGGQPPEVFERVLRRIVERAA